MKTLYSYDPATGSAECILYFNNQAYYGHATCHPDDKDMESEKTGLSIAESRAFINLLLSDKKALQQKYQILNDFYHTINQSKKFNEKSYENKMLQRQLRITKDQLAAVNADIANEKQSLKNFIDKKDKFYKKLREQRQRSKETN